MRENIQRQQQKVAIATTHNLFTIQRKKNDWKDREKKRELNLRKRVRGESEKEREYKMHDQAKIKEMGIKMYSNNRTVCLLHTTTIISRGQITTFVQIITYYLLTIVLFWSGREEK